MGKRAKNSGGRRVPVPKQNLSTPLSASSPNHDQQAAISTSVACSLDEASAPASIANGDARNEQLPSPKLMCRKEFTPLGIENSISVKTGDEVSPSSQRPDAKSFRQNIKVFIDRPKKYDQGRVLEEEARSSEWPFHDNDMLTSWREEEKNAELKAHRATLWRACDVSTEIRQGPTATLLWRKDWGAFSKFTQHDHETSISVNTFSGMQRFQPVCKEDVFKLVSSLFERSPNMLFLPVDSSFVSLRHLREGVKFVVRDPSDELKELLDANDYLLFAGSFDVMKAACDAGVLFKENDLVLGVILCDAYSFFMADLSSNVFTKSFKVVINLPDSKPNEIHKLTFLHLVSRAMWFRSQAGSSLSPKRRMVEFCFKARNYLFPYTTIKWNTHIHTGCPMEIAFRLFAENLGESESAFAFSLGNDKKRLDGTLPIGSGKNPLRFRVHLNDPKKSGCLNDYAFLGNEKELLLHGRLSMTRLTVILKWAEDPSSVSGRCPSEFKFLVSQQLTLHDLIPRLNKETVKSFPRDSCLRFLRVNDGTLLKVPDSASGSLRDMADYAGIDPVQMVLVLAHNIPESDVRTVLPFGRAPSNGKIFRTSKHVLVWQGDIAFEDVSCFARMSMSTAISPAEQKAIRDKSALWPNKLKHFLAVDRTLMDDASVLNADNSFELLVTFNPTWPKEVENHEDDILLKLKDYKMERAFFLFYFLEGEGYGMLHFDQESDAFKMRLAKEVAADSIDKISSAYNLGFEIPLFGANAAAREENNMYILGVMTFKSNAGPCFSVICAKEYFEARIDGLFETTYCSDQPSHVWLEIEEKVFKDALRKRANRMPGKNIVMEVAGSIEYDKYYLAVAGTAEEVNVLITNRDHARLAKTMMLVKKMPDGLVYICCTKRLAREGLAKFICEGRSPSVTSSLKLQLGRDKTEFKRPDLSQKWTRSLEGTEAPESPSSAAPTSAKPEAPKTKRSRLIKKTAAVGPSLVMMKERRKRTKLLSAATGMSRDDVIAKLEALRLRLAETILTDPEKSAEVDSVLAEARSAAREEVAASGPSLKACTFCRSQALEMKVCGRCKVTHYCSQKCQTTDWRRHKADCRENHKSRMDDLVKLL